MKPNGLISFLGALFFSVTVSLMECAGCGGSGMVSRLNTIYVDCIPYSNFELGQCTFCFGTGKKPEPCSERFSAPETIPDAIPYYWNYSNQENDDLAAFPLFRTPLLDMVSTEFERNEENDAFSNAESPSFYNAAAAACCSCFFPSYFKTHLN